MSQRTVEQLVGRIITDDSFRAEFLAAPEATLHRLAEQGYQLSRTEIAALINTDADVWVRGAAAIDARLRKVNLLDSAAPH